MQKQTLDCSEFVGSVKRLKELHLYCALVNVFDWLDVQAI